MCSLIAAKAARCLFLPALKRRGFQELSFSLLDNKFAQVLKKTGADIPLEIFPV